MTRRSRAEEAAAEFLAKHGVTEPPVPVDEIVAAEDIKVGRVRSKGREIGFALRQDDVRTIGVDLCRSQVHQRWIVAHCLGHLLLHDKQLIVDHQVSVNPRDETTTLGSAFEEQQASTFAAELLMPRLMVARLVAETATLETARDDVVLPLAELFQVGRDAMISRLIALGVIQP